MVVIKICGKTLEPEIEMSEYQTIYQLKTSIALQLGVKVERQTLIFNDEILENQRQIYEYNLGSFPRIGLVVEALAEPKEFNIVAKSSSEEFEIAVVETTTVGDLKKAIHEESNCIIKGRMFLFRLDKEMEDDDDLPVSEYYIYEQGCLVEFAILPGYHI